MGVFRQIGSLSCKMMKMMKWLTRSLLGVLLVLAAVMAWANWPAKVLPEGAKAERLVVRKATRTLTVERKGKPLAVYAVSLGRKPLGKKEREGDLKTPEGVYRIVAHKEDSTCYRALRISYPERRDLVLEGGRRQENPGGNIMIHGLKNGWGWLGRCHRWMDWTAGCVAVTNDEMDELWHAVSDGTPVELRP